MARGPRPGGQCAGWGAQAGVGAGEQGADTSSVAAQTSLAPRGCCPSAEAAIGCRLAEVARAMLVQPWLPKVPLVSCPLVPLNLCPAVVFFFAG